MTIYQPKEGYRYNSDSIFLYDFISSFAPKGRLLDIGCGVGVISLLLGRDFELEITAIDKQERMIKYARDNFATNGIDADIIISDIADFAIDQKFDYIISNPPFYDSAVTQSNNEHINIARYSHHMPISVLVSSVKRLLAPRGYFIFCYDAKQIDTVIYELKKAKINPEIIQFVHPKADRDAKIAMVSARAGSKSMLKVLPPFITFDEDGQYMPKAKEAFEKANTNAVDKPLL